MVRKRAELGGVHRGGAGRSPDDDVVRGGGVAKGVARDHGTIRVPSGHKMRVAAMSRLNSVVEAGEVRTGFLGLVVIEDGALGESHRFHFARGVVSQPDDAGHGLLSLVVGCCQMKVGFRSNPLDFLDLRTRFPICCRYVSEDRVVHSRCVDEHVVGAVHIACPHRCSEVVSCIVEHQQCVLSGFWRVVFFCGDHGCERIDVPLLVEESRVFLGGLYYIASRAVPDRYPELPALRLVFRYLLLHVPLHDGQPDLIGGVPIIHGDSVEISYPCRVLGDDIGALRVTQGCPPVIDLVSRPGRVRLFDSGIDDFQAGARGGFVERSNVVVNTLKEGDRVGHLVHQERDLVLIARDRLVGVVPQVGRRGRDDPARYHQTGGLDPGLDVPGRAAQICDRGRCLDEVISRVIHLVPQIHGVVRQNPPSLGLRFRGRALQVAGFEIVQVQVDRLIDFRCDLEGAPRRFQIGAAPVEDLVECWHISPPG